MEDDLRRIVQSLNDANVRYLVVGPFAVVAHGCMPLTANLELCLLLGAGGEERVRRCLGEIGHQKQGEFDLKVVFREGLDFEEMYARAERFELAAGVEMAVCGYGDLVRLKRQTGRLADLADLDQLEKARRPRPAYDPWYECTFEGNELWQIWNWADLTLAERIRSLEDSRKVGRMFREARRKRGLKSIFSDGHVEE